MVIFEQFHRLLVPGGTWSSILRIIKGSHGYSGGPDQLPRGAVPNRKDDNIVHASQPCEGCTNQKSQ